MMHAKDEIIIEDVDPASEYEKEGDNNESC